MEGQEQLIAPNEPIQDQPQTNNQHTGQEPTVKEPGTQNAKDSGLLTGDEPEGYQKRFNSVYGQLKGTQRERDHYKTKYENLEQRINTMESEQAAAKFESQKNQLKSQIRQARDAGDDALADDLHFQYQEILSQQHANQKPGQPRQEPEKSQPTQPESVGKQRFFEKYADRENDQNFVNFAKNIGNQLAAEYANELQTGEMTEDELYRMLDREITRSQQSNNSALRNFQASNGIMPNAPTGKPAIPQLTDSQKRLAMRLVQNGVYKTQEEAFRAYANSRNQ